jgi:hypothetical protein
MSDPARDELEKLLAEFHDTKEWVEIFSILLSRREAKGWNEAIDACVMIAQNSENIIACQDSYFCQLGDASATADRIATEIRKLLKKEGEV